LHLGGLLSGIGSRGKQVTSYVGENYKKLAEKYLK
jgi:hypothetical protein